MHALDEPDRTAVLLRYFENKSLREVGHTLGTTEDAARKRVSRAVERLREFFAKRGVTVGASGLVVVISANAVQAAPGWTRRHHFRRGRPGRHDPRRPPQLPPQPKPLL